MPAPYTPPTGLLVNLDFEGAYVRPVSPHLVLNFEPTGSGGSPNPPTVNATNDNFMTLLLS